VKTLATFSPDRMFRYTLERIWDETLPPLLVIMLNPSVADAERNDPTITRVMQRAKRLGYGGVVVCNLYAFRSPYPAKLRERWRLGAGIIGPSNDLVIREAAQRYKHVWVAWGGDALAAKRDKAVLDILYGNCCSVYMLELTKDGFPKHPLHVAYDVPLTTYKGRHWLTSPYGNTNGL
jgi:hypothetical protein